MQGAERKTRDEERRAAKRKLTVTGRKKMDELYHPPCDRSEFYAMSDLLKPPMLFSPTEDLDKVSILIRVIVCVRVVGVVGVGEDLVTEKVGWVEGLKNVG